MANWNLGGTINNTSGFSGPWGANANNYVQSASYAMPTARVSLGGTFPIYIGTLYPGYTSGPYNGIQITYQAVATSGGTLFANSGSTCSLRFYFTGGGTLYFGRNTTNGLTVTFGRGGTPLTGGLVGSLDWAQVATAPQSLVVVPGPGSGQIAVSWAAPANNGDSGLVSYDIQYATVLGGPWTSAGLVAPAVLSTNISPGPGGPYYVRVIANNGVGSSVAATSGSAVMPTGGGKRYGGVSWAGLTIARRFNGASWVDLVTRKRYDGANWVNIT